MVVIAVQRVFSMSNLGCGRIGRNEWKLESESLKWTRIRLYRPETMANAHCCEFQQANRTPHTLSSHICTVSIFQIFAYAVQIRYLNS